MTVREHIEEYCEDTILLENYDYDSALIGITEDDRAVYDYDLMVEYLLNTGDFESNIDAMEWIDYNTIRAIGYMGEKAPVIIHTLKNI